MDIGAWLVGLGLERYAAAFAANDIDESVLRLLSEDDLKDLGVGSVGHRRRLCLAIAALADRPAEAKSPARAAPVAQARPAAPVGAGRPASPPAPAAQPAPATRQPPPPPKAAPDPPRETGGAAQEESERRLLSVLYCEVPGVDAMGLSLEGRLEFVAALMRDWDALVQRHGGRITNFHGERALAYFGWPSASEGTVEQAVRCGLALAAAGGSGAAAVRVGLATGPVVVGELIDPGPSREQSAVGVAPNLGARLLELASPGQVLMDDATRRLLGSGFETYPQGSFELKGIAAPVAAHVVLRERAIESRFEGRRASGAELAPLVGRDQEVVIVLERWNQALRGEGVCLLLQGEAGIGKSRIVKALSDELSGQPHFRVLLQCSPYHCDTALWPVAQQMRLSAGIDPADATEVALDKLERILRIPDGEPRSPEIFAALLGLQAEHRYGPTELSPQALRSRVQSALVARALQMAASQPMLMIVEDAHWIDPSTLELLELLLDSIGDARLMLLVTSRTDHLANLSSHPNSAQVTLNRLHRAAAQQIITRLGGSRLAAESVDAILSQTDGVPLFIEELTRACVESGDTAVPASLHESLMARLDRVPDVKQVAQIAACIGREFTLPMLAAVSQLPLQQVESAAARLCDARLLFRRGSAAQPVYTFKHALVRDAAYESLLRSRRQVLHAAILQQLEADPVPGAPEILAHHAVNAGQHEKAVDHWMRAGREALLNSAYREAAAHLGHALQALASMREDPARDAREFSLQVRLGQARAATHGISHSSTVQAFSRARALMARVRPEPDLLMTTYYGVWVTYSNGGRFPEGLPVAREFIAAAAEVADAACRLVARRVEGFTHLMMGHLRDAHASLTAALDLYDPAQHHVLNLTLGNEPGAMVCCHLGVAEALLGRFDKALALVDRACEINADIRNVSALGYHHLQCMLPCLVLRDIERMEHHAARLSAVMLEHRLPMWQAMSDVVNGWLLVLQGRAEEAQAVTQRGLEGLAATETRLHVPIGTGVLASAQAANGRMEEARWTLQQAIVLGDQTGQHWYQPELWRLRGSFFGEAQPEEAVRSYERAMAIARQQGAVLWELRAAVSLAQLQLQLGRREEALDLLAPLADAMAGAGDGADLRSARELVVRLRARTAE